MHSRAKSWRAPWLYGLLYLAFAAAMGSRAEAQVAPTGFFSDPVLILGGNGHHAPVRSMVFATPDGSQLLTGGMDKVIHVWDLDVDRSGPSRTLRPPNWRGPRGQVNAMALSPRDDGGNQRLLAVAGHGVLGSLGDILLFRYPGPTAQGTGDIEGQLPSTAPDGTIGPGHLNVVTSLAFTPDGRFLASSSNDKTVQIWEVATRRRVAVLGQATAEVNALALFANGTRLVAGGTDGVLRLYDITDRARPVFIAQAPPVRRNQGPLSSQILTLAASPDDRWIVVGTEGAALVRYEAANLGNAQFLPDVPTGPVEAVAISPDGTRLATSIIARDIPGPADFPTVSCVVELRSMPSGQVVERLPIASNVVRALAFSPDGRRLAYSGGDAQAIYIKDLAPGSPPLPDEIKGPGASLWDVGFRADGRAIRFARSRPVVPGQAAEYEYFDLRGRFFFNPAAGGPAYRHAVASETGWTIRPVDPFQFDFRNAQNQGWQRSLDPTNERRWWAYTVIPPGPGHLQPVAAVAADAGVVLWNLATGEKTRSFNGHAGPVYALASSPDGRWLVTGSSDQTVRLWPLAGCDRPPAFGAKFERRADGAWAVAEVVPGGFADGIALRKGHVVEKLFVGDFGPAQEVDPAGFLPRLDLESPTKMFTIYARMPGEAARFRGATTKRDSPALTLFPGVDRRWVLWTPRGFYDSSADGDRRFLGWLTNRGTVAQLLAGTFDSIDKFEAKYRQPRSPGNVLDRLLDTADPLQVVAAANPAVPDPTTSRLDALAITPADPAIRPPGPVAVAAPTLPVNYRAVAATGAALIRELWVEINGKRLLDNLSPVAPVRVVQGQLALPIGAERDVRANLVVIDALGVRRSQPLDISNQAPPPPKPRRSRLEVVAIGAADFSDKRFPRVEFAEEDARDLARFLGDRLIDPATGARFGPDQVHVHSFLGSQVARGNILTSLDELRKAALAGDLGLGDVVALVVESHFLEFHSKRLLLTTEPDSGESEPASLSATDLADRLGEFTRLGCRAVVLVDAVHEIKGTAREVDIQEWVRQLQSQANAVAFIAADHGPSSPNGDGHRAFAQGVLDVLKARSAGRPRKPGTAMSLFDFGRTVTDTVLEQTGRKQHAQLYLPDTMSFQVPFLDRSPPRR